MKILLIGDVFGRPGRRAVSEYLPKLIEKESLDLVIANGENAAGGKGITPQISEQFFDIGIDVITSGNHARDKKEIDPLLDSHPRMLRPLNYPQKMPGKGHAIVKAKNGVSVAIVNAIGKVHMANVDSPFEPTKDIVRKLRKETPIVIVDFHAEATSEKRAMGWWLDGHASAVMGTHTHVQTADEEILPQGTAYISDVGMTGPHASIIGLRTDLGLERFLTGQRGKFDVGKEDVRFCGAIVDVDETTGKANSIRRIRQDIPTE